MDVEKTDVPQVEELDELKPESIPPKSNTLKVGKRTAFVYTGAAILIVVVGLRTLLQMADEGFGMVEYITIGALMIEFSVLLLYAFTIYSVSKDDAQKESFAVQSKDMPAVAQQLRMLSESVSTEIQEMRIQNDRLHSLYNKDYPALSNAFTTLAEDFKLALQSIQDQKNDAKEQIKLSFEGLYDSLQSRKDNRENENDSLLNEKFLDQLSRNEESSNRSSQKLLEQLEKNEQLMRDNFDQISALTKGLKEIVEEQVTLRIRQEIQHILSAPIVNRSNS